MSKLSRFPKGNLISESHFGKIYSVQNQPNLVVQECDLDLFDVSKRKCNEIFKQVSKFEHPHIIRLENWFFEDNLFYPVFERLEGETLDKIILDTKSSVAQFYERFIFEIFSQIVSAVKYLHQHNILHQNLSPENILLLNRENTIKLIDFQLSKSIAQPDFNQVIQEKTPAYQAPESFQSGKHTVQRDIWSLGIILYELITLECPFRFETFSDYQLFLKSGEFAPITRNCSQELKDTVSAILQFDPSKRLSLNEIEDFFAFQPFKPKSVSNQSNSLVPQDGSQEKFFF